MLKITHDAAVALSSARAAAGAPDQFGARFSITNAPEQGGARLAITFVESPAAGDTVSEQEGLNVYVAPELVQAIPDATVDAKPMDGETQLVLERA